MILKSLIFIFVLAAFNSQAAAYLVKTNGNNALSGLDLANAWLTIAKAASTMVAGDSVEIQDGIYNEVVTETTSGTAGNFITYKGASTNAICRGFALNGVSYVRVINMGVTQIAAPGQRGIAFQNTCSNLEIIGNAIINTGHNGISAQSGSTTSYIKIRGNYIKNPGIIPGVVTNLNNGIVSVVSTSDHWLVEYNTVDTAVDFVNVFGTDMIVRNNYLHRFNNQLYNTTDSTHSDMFQPGSDGGAAGTRNHLYERNFTQNSMEANSHLGLWRDTVAAGDSNLVVRGNIGNYFGSSAASATGADWLSVYNNTFVKMCQMVSSGSALISFSASGGNVSVSNLVANVLISDTALVSSPIQVGAGSQALLMANLGYATGTNSSFVSTNDPLFVATNIFNFRLQAASPARGSGTNVIYTTSANGSGTSFDVNNGFLLSDGKGLTDGDIITINGTTVRVTSISGNTVTVSASVTWTNGMPVYWGTDTSPDIGALPYESTALTGAAYQQFGNYYRVYPTGDARGVWFYENGIPVSWDNSSPYEYTSSGGTVVPKAYALYAQTDPVFTATPLIRAISSGTLRSNTTFRP